MKKRILVSFLIIIILFSNNVNAFYNYSSNFQIFNLNRNIENINYIISYDKNSFTNEDVNVKIEFDKPITIIGDNSNEILSTDGKTISKTLDSNANNKLLVRDENFNYKEIEYNVDWIDKIPPIITGAENGQTYNKNVHLDYKDNTNIKEIYSDYYSDSFSIYTESYNFYETDDLQIVPANKNSITIYVTSNTKQMEKYNYYMDGTLYATTHDKKYTFSGLELSDDMHNFIVEALDRNGNVLDVKETYRKTEPIGRMEFGLSNDIKYLAMKEMPENRINAVAYAWVEGHKQETYQQLYMLFDEPNCCVVALFMDNFNNYSGIYNILFQIDYINSVGENKRLEFTGAVNMPNKYTNNYYSGLPDDFSNNGNYYVRCIDVAGNEKELCFSIQK